MTTPQQLIDLSAALTDVADGISDFVFKHTDPAAPTDPALGHLSDLSAQIALKATGIGHAGLAALAADVGSAINSLNFQVGQATAAIKKIDDAQKALDIASAVLVAAASVAASTATGNWIGTASAVVTLAESVHKTLAPSP